MKRWGESCGQKAVRQTFCWRWRLKKTIERYLELSSKITRLHVKHVWADYDKEADVLYLSFRKPQRAKKTVEMGDDVLIRSDGDEVVGITVLNAGSRGGLRAEARGGSADCKIEADFLG